MSDYETSIDIDADAETIFDYLITDTGMTAWMGEYAELDARPGGQFAVQIAGAAVRGEYLHVEPYRRVVFSWGMSGSDDLPPGASTVEFTLTPAGQGTRVHVVHAGLPDIQRPGHQAGWAHFLPRLALIAAGISPGPDSWTPRPTSQQPGGSR